MITGIWTGQKLISKGSLVLQDVTQLLGHGFAQFKDIGVLKHRGDSVDINMHGKDLLKLTAHVHWP